MKILILTAKAGGGHLAMANSLQTHMAAQHKDISCRIVRIHEFSTPGFEFFVNETYIWMVNHASRTYRYFYNKIDRDTQKKLIRSKIRRQKGKSPRLGYAFQRAAMRRFKNLIEREKPDLVISCYHYCNILAYKARYKYNLDFKIINVLADYVVSSVYYCDMVDAHICSSETDEQRLLEIGVPQNKIHRLGIPIHERFFKNTEDKIPLYTYLHLPQQKTAVLLGGAFGGGKLNKVVKELLAAELDYSLVVLCGTNKRLRRRLEKLSSAHCNLYPVGYTHEIDKYMDIADVLVSKVGGNGISEAFAKRVPIIMVNPLPGQEQYNAEYLHERKMAVFAANAKEVVTHMREIIENPALAEELKANIDKNFKRTATKDICDLAIKLASE